MKKALLLVFIIFVSSNLFSQQSSIYIGYKSMRELNVSYDYSLGNNKKVGATFGYIFASDYEREYGAVYPDGNTVDAFTRKRNQQGISLSTFLKFINGKEGRLILVWTLEYQYLKSGNYFYNEYYYTKFFSDPVLNTSGRKYSEFKHTYNNLTLLFGVHHLFLKNNTADIYFEWGIAYKDIRRIYSIDGYDNQQWPSNNIEDFWKLTPTFRVGLNFRIFNFEDKLKDSTIK